MRNPCSILRSRSSLHMLPGGIKVAWRCGPNGELKPDLLWRASLGPSDTIVAMPATAGLRSARLVATGRPLLTVRGALSDLLSSTIFSGDYLRP
jgi:hypothetical protein